MGGNTGEIQIGSERELYKYINHQAGTTKVYLPGTSIFFYLGTCSFVHVCLKKKSERT